MYNKEALKGFKNPLDVLLLILPHPSYLPAAHLNLVEHSLSETFIGEGLKLSEYLGLLFKGNV
jgi:hypothetical protein